MSALVSVIKAVPFLNRIRMKLDNQFERDAFVSAELAKLPAGALLLDAGSGSQRYRSLCARLQYRAQDFGGYAQDAKDTISVGGASAAPAYQYGKLDYVGDIWAIPEKSETFDAVLCTEVLEHILYPNETVAELSRLLKKNGTLILTAPSNCLRHMDPYFFYSGFSDRWFETVLAKSGLKIETLSPVGDYYSWLSVEMARTGLTHSWLAKLLLAPAFLYYYAKRKTSTSVNALCMGYHVVARKV